LLQLFVIPFDALGYFLGYKSVFVNMIGKTGEYPADNKE